MRVVYKDIVEEIVERVERAMEVDRTIDHIVLSPNEVEELKDWCRVRKMTFNTLPAKFVGVEIREMEIPDEL